MDGVEIKFDAEELNTILDNAYEDVGKHTERVSLECSDEAVKALKDTSPRKKGDYAGGWDKQKAPDVDYGYVVWNAKHYQLTHLLEKGHQVCNQFGGPWGRAAAHPHIRPVEQKMIPKYLSRIKDIKFR